jgi:two-component system, NarL family, nitrate/nitrite response regulator NarL
VSEHRVEAENRVKYHFGRGSRHASQRVAAPENKDEKGVMVMDSAHQNRNISATRILVADDHRLIAEAVAAVLVSSGKYVVETADSFEATIKHLKNSELFRIVMLDLRMPGMNGLESIKKIVDAAGDGFVVLFSSNADRHMVTKAVGLGVRGLIPKNMPLKALVSVLQLIESGETFIPVTKLINVQNSNEPDLLSDIEISILKEIAAGMTNKQIANDMDLTEATIKMHMRTICRKLGARNRARAAIIGRNMGIIDV